MNNNVLLNKINQTIEYYLPRKANKKFYQLLNIDQKYPVEVLDKGLLEPFWDFMERGGKRWRVLLFCYVYNSLTGNNSQKYLPLAIIPEIIHNASLIIDDIEDNSDIRRNKPCLHKIYGEDVAINLGNLLYFLPYSILKQNKQLITAAKYSKIRQLIDQEMLNIHLGQNFDIVGHRGLIRIQDFQENDYRILVSNKTGCMIRLALQMVGILAKANKETISRLGQLGTNIATIFQVTDDLLNLTAQEKKYGKEIGGDISEAKITLMIIDCLKKAPKSDNQRLRKILSLHTKDQKIILEAISILKKYHSLEYVEKYCQELLSRAKKIVRSIHFRQEPIELRQLLDSLITREK